MNTRKISILTSTRADWGLLSPIARALSERPDCDVSIIATNMHLNPLYGHTVDEIIADGFTVDERVEMTETGDDDASRVRAAAQCMSGMAGAFSRLKPDIAVILGDRYEMLAAAQCAALMRIPIVHIAGGELSEGAVDDSMRHAITKLSSLHLTATEPYRKRVISMGEDPKRVINSGAIGVYNIEHEVAIEKSELEKWLGISIDRRTLLVTYHPATLDDEGDDKPADVADSMLRAIEHSPASNIIITYPNNDSRGREIIDRIETFGSRYPDRVKVVPSLGKRRYLSALRYIGAVVGNSSSGIVEVPSMGIPTVDIGPRQRSRIAADSVIHCSNSENEILQAINTALSPEFAQKARHTVNPYRRDDTLSIIVDAIATYPLSELTHKRFYDLEK